jgi:predicted Zn-ribbon and HTH transcriptional regulator
MISISLSQLLLLLMIPGLISVGLWWLNTVWKEHRRDRTLRQSTLRCRICGCVYPTPEEPGTLTRCPSCKSSNLNEPQKLI